MEVLVIAAHPDDETLGVGGTILKHISAGDSVHWLVVTNISVEAGFDQAVVAKREAEIEAVSTAFGFSSVTLCNFDTATLSSGDIPQLVPKISEVLSKLKPQAVYVMNRSDVHSDHRIVFDAVAGATKSFRHGYIEKILMYECISETEFAPALQANAFVPNYFIDISEFLEKKIEIMKVYESELGNHPFPRSEENIRAFATIRGASCGVNSAEAFQLLKCVEK